MRGRTEERERCVSLVSAVESGIFVAECRRDRAASSHELQAWLVFVGAFESRVDRRRSFAAEHAAAFSCPTISSVTLYVRERTRKKYFFSSKKNNCRNFQRLVGKADFQRPYLIKIIR